MTAERLPEKLGNICNAANFYPIWLAAGCWMMASLGKGRNVRARQLWPLFGCLLAFTLFALCPLPAFVGRLTLLSFTTEDRLILPIGFGGILLSILVLREIIESTSPLPTSRRLTLLAVCAGIAIAVLLAAAAESPKFFTPWRLAEALALALALFTLYFWPTKQAFALLMLAALVPPALNVNPVTQGLAPLTESTAVKMIEEIRRADPGARWVAFDGANQSALLMAAGVEVLSGAKTLPDLPFYRELDPTSRDLEIYNRYSLGLFHVAPLPGAARFQLFDFCAHNVSIYPLHPALLSRQVRYFVFPNRLENPAAVGLRPFKAIPGRELWIYRPAQT